MARVLSFLIRYFSNYYTLHRSDLAARAAPLDPRLLLLLLLVIWLMFNNNNYKHVTAHHNSTRNHKKSIIYSKLLKCYSFFATEKINFGFVLNVFSIVSDFYHSNINYIFNYIFCPFKFLQ